MRIVFMGTPEFAIPSLNQLLRHGYDVVSVVTAPDRPKGRGQRLSGSPVKEFALQHQIPVFQPERLKTPEVTSAIAAYQPDLIVVVAFRILPPEIFTLPRSGSVNLHASLLPRYRGAAPINWAIINGENETGVTTFFLREKVDTGAMIMQARTSISPDETAGELHDRLAELGARVLLESVQAIESNLAVPQVQDETCVSLAPKIFREQCEIDWNRSSVEIHNFVRGLSPSPCAWTMLHGKVFRVYRTSRADVEATRSDLRPGDIGVVEPDRVLVRTQTGVIALEEVQQEGRKRMRIAEFLRGYPLKSGDRLGSL